MHYMHVYCSWAIAWNGGVTCTLGGKIKQMFQKELCMGRDVRKPVWGVRHSETRTSLLSYRD